MKKKADARKPNPRKHGKVWQEFMFYDGVSRQLVRHRNRLKAIQSGRSDLDLMTETMYVEWLSDTKNKTKKALVFDTEQAFGGVYDWLRTIKGLKDGTIAAGLLALIDDIGSFDTVSKLWRFCGLAVIDGKAEHNERGETSHYNHRLKVLCFLIGDQFIKQQTPLYVDIYYAEKKRLRELHPEKIKNDKGKWMYNDGHLHNMALRKMEKIFLQHLWLKWREQDGLPISLPYAQAILGHSHIVLPE